jgi:hypothetical protein
MNPARSGRPSCSHRSPCDQARPGLTLCPQLAKTYPAAGWRLRNVDHRLRASPRLQLRLAGHGPGPLVARAQALPPPVTAAGDPAGQQRAAPADPGLGDDGELGDVRLAGIRPPTVVAAAQAARQGRAAAAVNPARLAAGHRVCRVRDEHIGAEPRPDRRDRLSFPTARPRRTRLAPRRRGHPGQQPNGSCRIT